MSNGFLSMGPDYTPGTTASATGSVLDDILYQLTRPVETEGTFTQAEALFENAYSELSKIQNQVAPEQQADALAEYLRTSGFSSHVVEQTLGIPREEVNVALAQAGYSETGQPLEEANLQNELLTSSVTGQSDVFFDYVDLAEENKVDLTQAEFADLVARTNAATSNEEVSQILTEAGIFHDTASLDPETGMDMGGSLMDRITITDASAQADSQAADAQAAAEQAAAEQAAADAKAAADKAAADKAAADAAAKAAADKAAADAQAAAEAAAADSAIATDYTIDSGGGVQGAKAGDWVYDSKDEVFRQVGGVEVIKPKSGDYTGQILNSSEVSEVFEKFEDTSTINPAAGGGGTLSGSAGTKWGAIYSVLGADGVFDEMQKTGKTVSDIASETGETVADINDALGVVTVDAGPAIGPQPPITVDAGPAIGPTTTGAGTTTGTTTTTSTGTGTSTLTVDAGPAIGPTIGPTTTATTTGTTTGTPTTTTTGTGTTTGTPTTTGTGTGTGRNGLIMMLAQQAPITEQMFSRELFEPKFTELDNVAQALGMLQSIARRF